MIFLAQDGEVRGVYCENLEENWPRYNGIAFDVVYSSSTVLFVTINWASNACIALRARGIVNESLAR